MWACRLDEEGVYVCVRRLISMLSMVDLMHKGEVINQNALVLSCTKGSSKIGKRNLWGRRKNRIGELGRV